MELFRIFIAAFSATNVMTTFSYLLSNNYGRLFKEPVLLNFVLDHLGLTPKGKLKKFAGWFAHYVIGFAFVLTYDLVWRHTDIEFGWLSGSVFGVVSGFIGILGWRLIFLLPREKPDVHLNEYYIQLMVAHILFALAVVIAFLLYEFDPIGKVNDAVN
ncbi:MAG: hypothetical protein IR153_10990 [Flavobacterium sp.]|nr:hypothetical protein [Flavobacterium sp.]